MLYPVRRIRRRRFALQYVRPSEQRIHRWASLWTEEDNFYYELTTLNRLQLCGLISLVTKTDRDLVWSYLDEVVSNADLRQHLESCLRRDPHLRDVRVAYGRREGWYALIRAAKPKLVVETGVHHGVGACVIASALLRNKQDGYPGRYLGTDIDLTAGRCFVEPYSDVGEVLFGDSIQSLQAISEPIDIFINDSDHSAVYERQEYDVIANKLGRGAIVVGDNSHASNSLGDFSLEMGRHFVFFKEEPLDHWYPGAGIGLSFEMEPSPNTDINLS